MRKAVLDLGTNTFHLLIADVSASGIRILFQDTIAVKIGEGGINKGFIAEEAFARGVSVVKDFARILLKHSVAEVKAAGTAALRTASNGPEFIDRVKRETGITIEIIDGDSEARLIYEGVKHGVRLSEERVLIMDIGGGSVEFIICNREGIFWKKSYPLGAAKLMDLFHHNDPISIDEVEQIHRHLDENLQELKKVSEHFKPLTLIGSAGSFETFATLVVRKFHLPQELLQASEFTFDLNQLREVSREILTSTHDERAASPDIIPVRVDMIVVATVLTEYILKSLNFSKMKLSTYALKEGLLYADQDGMMPK